MPNFLIPENEQTVIESREVADMVGKQHSELLKDIRRYASYLSEGKIHLGDFFIESSYQDINNQIRPCFLLTKQGCEMVANKLTGRKGTIFTAKYVRKFNEMQLNKLDSYMIEDPVKRAEKWIQERKQIQTLQVENLEMKPKALFADSVSASETTVLIRDLAKLMRQNEIEIGEKRLFEWLRENGFLIKRKGSDFNMPTQKSMELGLFRIKETTINRTNGISIVKTPKVTGKGQLYFINKFLTNKNKIGVNG